MTKIGLWLRLKLAFRMYRQAELWAGILYKNIDSADFRIGYKERCDALIGDIPRRERNKFIELLEEKKRFMLNKVATGYGKQTIERARLFQLQLLQEQFERVTKDEQRESKKKDVATIKNTRLRRRERRESAKK